MATVIWEERAAKWHEALCKLRRESATMLIQHGWSPRPDSDAVVAQLVREYADHPTDECERCGEFAPLKEAIDPGFLATKREKVCAWGCDIVPERGRDMSYLKYRSESADDLRGLGWRVAIHNDYEKDGEVYTFWLMTKKETENRSVALKGEGKFDADALDQIRSAIALFGQ